MSEKSDRQEQVKTYERRNAKIYGTLLVVVVLVVVVWAVVSNLG